MKTERRKKFCNFSLVWLMHSCSSELISKISKPKTSRSPMKVAVGVSELESDSLTRRTSRSKMRCGRAEQPQRRRRSAGA